MQPSDDDADDEMLRRELEALQDELDTEQYSWNGFIKTRLMRWLVRQIISFTIISIFTYFWPELYWLWWVGIGIAALSLAALVVGNFVIQRKIRQARQRFAHADAALMDSEVS